MQFQLPPRHWRLPILFAIALVVSTVLRIPLPIRALLFGGIAIAQGIELWRTLLSPQRPGNVTYWRGVRYEKPRPSSITADDLRANAIPVIIFVCAVLIAGILALRSIGL
jgi:hypothetical protein